MEVLFYIYRYIFYTSSKQVVLVGIFLCLLINISAQDSNKLEVGDSVSYFETIADSLRFTNPELSISYYNQALQFAKDNNFKNNEAIITSKIGSAKYIMGEYDYALEYYMNSLQLSEEISDKKGIAVGYNNCALIYAMQKRYAEAISYHRLSINICKEINDSLLLANNLMNIGITFEMEGAYDSAHYYANRAIGLFLELGHSKNAVKVYTQEGETYVLEKKFNEAIEMYTRVLNDNDYHNQWEIVFAKAGMAKAYLGLGKFEIAEDYGLQSYEIARALNLKWDLQNITIVLSKIYAGLGKWEKAYDFQILYNAYADSVFNEAKEKQINFLKLKRADTEKAILLQENISKQKLIELKDLQMWLFTIGSILLLLVLFLLARNNFIKTKLNKKLNEKNSEIDSKNRELTSLIGTKDTLLRIIAHDLRSPIGIMISFTDLLKEHYNEFDAETVLDFINKLNRTSRDGFELLENLLEWAKSQTGGITQNPKTQNLKEIVKAVVDSMMVLAIDKKILIEILIEEGLTMYVDKDMLTIIIRNLISNAIKFTNPGGKITIKAIKEKGYMRFSVTDTGIGIGSENISKIFQLDKHFSTRGTQNEKGTGLGLVICKDFIEMMNGKIEIESEVGVGTEMKFDIPLK